MTMPLFPRTPERSSALASAPTQRTPPALAGLLTLAILLVAGCDDGLLTSAADDESTEQVDEEEADPDTVAFVTGDSVLATWSSRFEEPARLVVQDGEAWEELWPKFDETRYDEESDERIPLPPRRVDFENKTVLVVASGTVSNMTKVRIDSVNLSAGDVEAFVSTLDCIVFPGGGNLPAQAIQIDRFEGEVEWHESEGIAAGCGAGDPW